MDPITMDIKVDKKSSLCCEELTYTVILKNEGQAIARNIKYANTIPNEVIFEPHSIYVNGVQKIAEDIENGISIGDIDIGETVRINYKFLINCSESECVLPETAPYVEEATIYKNTSYKNYSEEERKRFHFWLHSYEPLGIEILEPTEVEILVKGDNITGSANLKVHDKNNLLQISQVTVNNSQKFYLDRVGELFLDITGIESTIAKDEKFSFTVYIVIQDKGQYMITPTLDVRSNKISDKVINDVEEFKQKVFELTKNGVLMISDNIRMYMPIAEYIPRDFDPIKTLDMHEDILNTYNDMVDLKEGNVGRINRPRKYFILNTPKYVNIGYMSAGTEFIDAAPEDTHLFFEPNWGLFHEYGHLFDIDVGFAEIINNLFSKIMAEKYIGFTWLWENDRAGYENDVILTAYQNYINGISNNTSDFAINTRRALYMLIRLTEVLQDFVKKYWSYYRNTDNMDFLKYKEGDSISYFIADEYAINSIPYLELYAYKVESKSIIEFVVEKTRESTIFIPENNSFDNIRTISLAPTVVPIYQSINPIIKGISNRNSSIEITINDNKYDAITDNAGKFTVTIPETIYTTYIVKITSIEEGKLTSGEEIVKLRNDLFDTKIEFLGAENTFAASVKFDIYNSKLVVEAVLRYPDNFYINDYYLGLELYNKNNILKKSEKIYGVQSPLDFKAAFDGQSYETGDYIKLIHREPYGKLKIFGDVQDAPIDLSLGFQNLDLSTIKFYIDEDNLRYTTN